MTVCKNIGTGVISDKDYIGMAPDSAISYDLGKLKPGEERRFYLLIYLKKDDVNLNKLQEEIEEIKQIDVGKGINKN